jgi:hypothetical protein
LVEVEDLNEPADGTFLVPEDNNRQDPRTKQERVQARHCMHRRRQLATLLISTAASATLSYGYLSYAMRTSIAHSLARWNAHDALSFTPPYAQ